ncbi:TonB-dependent receptor plug domain-containing protein [Govanella unica]|uniref:TonB-dependent receptor n=1 Tax=Govanella unica TaxID=2975056 RepID=A0A9X3TV57_9PROT|nr:TonB-dependent receptor [Govania unica]MDA5192635.1 TonB-dependent receptor [Govania unica]
MAQKKWLLASTALGAMAGLISTAVFISSASAQPKPAAKNGTGDDSAIIEQVLVTGTYIKRKSQLDSPAPLSIIDGADLAQQGFTSASDAARFMTINSGSELNSDAFTQNFSTGTANINLRGLGLSSTLVLINGRRQTLSSAYADDGDTFVDTNALMPLIMIDRIEVLKDGAAALYGTDAVAGVVNYITRNDFRGFEATARFQTTTQSSQRDVDLGLIGGWGNDKAQLVAALSYKRRSELLAADRDFTRGSGISASGQPGSVFGLVPGNPAFPAIDPGCAKGTNSIPHLLAPRPAGLPFDIGTCDFDFSPYYSLVPKEERIQAYATGNIKFSDSVEFFAELGYSGNSALRSNAPSFPVASPEAVPGNHPGIPAALRPLWPTSQPRLFLGRILGDAAGVSPSEHDSDTYRLVGGLRGDLTGTWSWETSVSYSKNRFFLMAEDVITSRYRAALNGHGGPDGNQWFNPFSTSIGATPDQIGIYNDPALIDYIVQPLTVHSSASLWTADARLSGSLLSLPAGDLGLAVGAQYRHEALAYDFNDAYNQQQFLFLVGGPNFKGSRDIQAGFVELAIPVINSFEIQAAARYEDYGHGVNTLDPKISALWRPLDSVTLRGSFGTAFRAPSLFQTLGSKTSLVNINMAGQSIFRAARTNGNLDLKPQNADVFNAGISWHPNSNFLASLDYWRFKYKNLIVQEDAQSIVKAALAGNAQAFSQLEYDGFNNLSMINVRYINAPSVTTDGIDMSASYTWPTAAGFVRLAGDATYVFKYNAVDQFGTPFEGAGRRNYGTFARSIPQWRGNAYLTVNNGNHLATAVFRYIDSYIDNENNAKVGAYTTLDVQYSYSFSGLFGGSGGSAITMGAINILDRQAPHLDTFGGYDSKVHDPRGRLVYVEFKQGF